MPFVSRPSKPVRKNILPVDPQLLRDVDAISKPYRQVMEQLDQVVQDVANEYRNRPDQLTQFQQTLSDKLIEALQNAIPRVTTPMSRQAFRSAMQAIKDLPKAVTLGFSFDATDPRAVAWARLRAGKMIVQISDEQLTMVRRLVANALQNGVPIPQLAPQIEQVVGLHDRWQRAVENAFNRDLESYLADGMPTPQAIARARDSASQYRSKLIKARARNIARTEVMASQNYGTFLGWLQAGEKGLLNLSITKKQWVTGPSGWKGITVCDICAPLGEMAPVPVTQSFPNGLLTPPAHPNCRCRMILIPPEV